MLKRMLTIVPLVFGSLPFMVGSAWLAAFQLGWTFPNIFHPSVTLTANQSFVGFLLTSFVVWPVVGVVATLFLIALYDKRKKLRRRKLVALNASLA